MSDPTASCAALAAAFARIHGSAAAPGSTAAAAAATAEHIGRRRSGMAPAPRPRQQPAAPLRVRPPLRRNALHARSVRGAGMSGVLGMGCPMEGCDVVSPESAVIARRMHLPGIWPEVDNSAKVGRCWSISVRNRPNLARMQPDCAIPSELGPVSAKTDQIQTGTGFGRFRPHWPDLRPDWVRGDLDQFRHDFGRLGPGFNTYWANSAKVCPNSAVNLAEVATTWATF